MGIAFAKRLGQCREMNIVASSEYPFQSSVFSIYYRHHDGGLITISICITKVMTTGDIGELTVDGKIVEVVTSFIFLGALITRDGLCDKEIRRRIGMGKAAMGGLTTVGKDRGITLVTKVKLVKALVFLIVQHGAETWTMRKADSRGP